MSDAAQSLLQAAREGDLGAMRTALAEGAGSDPNAFGEALIEAARAGQTLAATYLLDQGADVNFVYDPPPSEEYLFTEFGPPSQTPLSEAIIADRIEIILLLVERGAHPSTPIDGLILAARHGNFSAVEFLLDRGAELYWQETEKPFDVRYSPALEEACAKGHLDIARLLLARGALLELTFDRGTLEDIDRYYHGWSPPRDSPLSPLAAAARCNKADVCRFLLEVAANPNADNGRAMREAARAGALDAIRVLLEFGADPTGLRFFSEDENSNFSFIARAMANGSGDAALLLLEQVGFPQRLMDEALCLACSLPCRNFEKLVEILLNQGANPDALQRSCFGDDSWATSLSEIAAWPEHIATFRLLLERSANPNGPISPDARPVWPPLKGALRGGNLEAVHLLLAAGAEPSRVEEADLVSAEEAQEVDPATYGERWAAESNQRVANGKIAAALIREAARKKRESDASSTSA